MSKVGTRQIISLIVILALASAGCSAGARRPVTPAPGAAAVAEAAPASAAQPEPPAPARPSVKSLLVSPIAEEPQAGRELISFSVKNVEIKDVLLGLSRMSSSNIVFEQDIAGKVSVDLKDVTIEEALKDALSPMGLEFTREGRTIRVTKQKVQTRIFNLNYIPTRRKGESQVFASGAGGAAAPAAGATTAAGGQAAGEQNTGFTRVKGEDTTNLWDEVKATLDRLLSPQGKYSINPMAGIVVVTDFSGQLEQIAKYIDALEASVRRQVLIQAEILEISLTEDFGYGIDFAGLPRSGTFKGLQSGLSGGGPTKSIFSQLLSPRSGIFNIGLADQTVAMMLDLLQKEGKLRVLSRPSVSTLNNQKAIIKVARDDVFFQKTTTLTTAGSTTSSTSNSVTVGIILSVTPQISSDGYIVMDIHPIVSELVEIKESPDGTATGPVVNARETNAVLRVKDGESIVIAGLVKARADRRVQRVPLLSRIPVLGLLFQRLDESSENSELVIKITPRIVAGGAS